MDNQTESTNNIKLFALNLGFSSVGIAHAEILTDEMERYHQWLNLGYYGTMNYLERNLDRREDIRLVLPNAQSVIVVAQNYYTPNHHQPEAIGKVSRYAWGDDYHDVLPPKLREIAIEVERLFPESSTKVYTDTGHLLEKAWAVRAGIGWQGKHSNIISRIHGSWFFIGIIITTARLNYDSPIEDFCGTCTACIDACPTKAIVQPYVVDGSKCLSFWTIETKPDIEFPLEINSNMDGWIFGCDECQNVCPWNRFSVPTSESRFEPRNEELTLSLENIQELTQDEFSTRFRNSPIKRTKLLGLKRNARELLKGKQHDTTK
ncbi:MAG: tRNA epoxyqueuosine(34) reductase QueG [Bacteroidetes bacterium]|nr:tRNA epoxyqueuosine(34) reductase QueG [Bacteroidota bacterium]